MADVVISTINMVIDLEHYSPPEQIYLDSCFVIRKFDQLDVDKQKWIEILLAANEIDSLEHGDFRFNQLLDNGLDEIQKRIYFLDEISSGKSVGTITAWTGEKNGNHMGRIHWLAIVPEYQGKALSKPLLNTALLDLKSEFDQAYLHTSTKNKIATKLYLDFGFIVD